jgi:hypothetical protein
MDHPEKDREIDGVDADEKAKQGKVLECFAVAAFPCFQ